MSAEPLTPEELEWLRRKATTAHETEADTEWADSPLFGADEVLALFAAIDSLSQELKAASERAAESNRWQMQYEEECEVHGETRAEVHRLRGALAVRTALAAAALTEPEES